MGLRTLKKKLIGVKASSKDFRHRNSIKLSEFLVYAFTSNVKREKKGRRGKK